MIRDIKFQMALVALIVAAIHYFVPDIDESSLVDVVAVVVALIFGGHSVAQRVKK